MGTLLRSVYFVGTSSVISEISGGSFAASDMRGLCGVDGIVSFKLKAIFVIQLGMRRVVSSRKLADRHAIYDRLGPRDTRDVIPSLVGKCIL